MRVLAILLAMVVVSGCQGMPVRDSDVPARPSQPSATAGGDPDTWEMGPDSFGPITAATTKAQALATGAFKEGPPPCNTLDWYSQTYQDSLFDQDGDGKLDPVDVDEDGTPDQEATKPLPSITMNVEGTGFAFIDPGDNTTMEHGIKVGSSLKQLKEAFGARLRHDPRIGYFIDGKQSYLYIGADNEGVHHFYMGAGKALGPDGVLAGRGGMC